MIIQIKYLSQDAAIPEVMELTPEDYFDPLNPGEELSVRSVARYQDAFEYTPYREEQVLWTVLEITDGGCVLEGENANARREKIAHASYPAGK